MASSKISRRGPLLLAMTAFSALLSVALTPLQSASASGACTTSLGSAPASWSASPRPISTKDELVYLSLNQTGNMAPDYALTANINLAGCTFTPIGTSSDPFDGMLDGGGFEISGLNVNATANGAGLIGFINLGASNGVKDLTVSGVVTSSADVVGGVIGSLDGSNVVENVMSRVNVTSTGSSVGGLVGQMTNAVIRSSSASGTVNGFDRVGGLAGIVFAGSSVTQSFATGGVNGNSDVGGLVGENQGTVSYSFATGNVDATGYAGGLLGSHRVDPVSISNSYASGSVTVDSGNRGGGLIGTVDNVNVSLSNVYARGLVSGGSPSQMGGLIGTISAGTPTALRSFWDIVTTGQSASAGGLGTAKNSAEMISLALYSAAPWDVVSGWQVFSTSAPAKIWGICSQVNGGYPFLLWEYDSDPCVSPGSGESGSSTAAKQLAATGNDEALSHWVGALSILMIMAGTALLVGRTRSQ